MKKTNVKIVLLIILGVLVTVLLAFGVRVGLLYVLIKSAEDFSLDEATMKIEITGRNMDEMFPVDEEAIPDSEYWDTVEDAVANDKDANPDGNLTVKVDEIIFQIESDQYASVFFRSIESEDLEWLVMAKFKKKEIDGKVKYTCIGGYKLEEKSDDKWFLSLKKGIQTSLQLREIDHDYSVYPGEKRFLWGVSRHKGIYSLKIEGQEPTGIIPYTVFGKQVYYWYYEDIQSDKPFGQMEFTVE